MKRIPKEEFKKNFWQTIVKDGTLYELIMVIILSI